jgi:hypothetical protein
MEGAILLGSIATKAIRTPERKEEFMTLMMEVMSDLIEESGGVRPEWPNPPEDAPEHERSGSA